MNDTATLKLNGKVALDDYAKALSGFIELMNSLSEELAEGVKIEWEISELARSSAITTVRGFASGGDLAIDRVVTGYYEVGRAIQKGVPIPFKSRVRLAANQITSILNGRVRGLVFETKEGDAEVLSPESQQKIAVEKPLQRQVVHGAVRGRVQSLTNRHSLRFTLYDTLHDSAVSCYLSEGSEDKMRNAWGRVVIVEGIVRRDTFTGYPTSIREISDIQIIPDSQGGWRGAIGVARGSLEGMLPEDAIRKVRDG